MITIVLLVSRPEYLDLVFTCLEMLECDHAQTNILTIVDGDKDLFINVRNRTDFTKFNDRLCVQYKTADKLKNFDLGHRRKRIADIHNFAKKYIKRSDYIFCVEDDTTFGTKTLKKLEQDYQMVPFAGMIQGVQIGRHGINHYGVWTVDDPYEPTQIESQDKGFGITICDAGGLYCMLTRAENYMAHDFKPFDSGDLGPDFDYGIALRKQGYKNYTDWAITCNHHTKNGIVSPKTVDTQVVKFVKIDHRWRQKTIL